MVWETPFPSEITFFSSLEVLRGPERVGSYRHAHHSLAHLLDWHIKGWHGWAHHWAQFLFSWLCCVACRILVPRPATKPTPPAVEAWSLNNWTTREVPLSTIWGRTGFNVFVHQPAFIIFVALYLCVLKVLDHWSLLLNSEAVKLLSTYTLDNSNFCWLWQK